MRLMKNNKPVTLLTTTGLFAGSAVQSGGSAIIFLALATALDKVHIKAKTQKLLFQE